MGLLILAATGVLSLVVADASDPYENQPKIISEGGHLIIMTAVDRNITLRTSGGGYVNVNNDNLLNVAQMARRASETVSRFRQNVQTNLQSRLEYLSRQITGRTGLASRLTSLEQSMASGNSSLPISSGPITGPRPPIATRVNRLAMRLRSIEIQVRSLRNLLTVDECLSNPCRNGGTCKDMFNGFQCRCPVNWQGTLCDEDVNECAMYAGTDQGCQNGATCVNKPGTYECLCADTYFGLHCTQRTNDCSAASSGELCGHGVCVNHGGNGRGYVCMCEMGWITDQSHSCTVDVDECKGQKYPCSFDPLVQCINLPGTYHCGFCPPGFTGNGFQCSDINECEFNNGGCSLGVPCINTRGSRMCGSCPPGFRGDGVLCAPVAGGSCAINNGGCHPVAQCYENAGIKSCRCPDGYSGTGYGPSGCFMSAVAPHPCHNNPCRNGGTCVPSGASATCVCHPHLTGADCSIVVFAVCRPDSCQNNGTCSVHETMGVTHTRCSCPPGFEGRYCELASSDCGGMFYQDSGELEVPTENTVQRYPNGKECVWRIEVSSGSVIDVNIKRMIIDPSTNCEQNYVHIIDPGLDNIILRKYCKVYTDGNIPKPSSQSNVLVIKFFATSGNHKNRFSLSWKAIKRECGKDIMVTEAHGSIDSPGYPQEYPPNLHCQWKLFAAPGKKIQLLFNVIDLEPSSDCSKDYLKIQGYVHEDDPVSLLAQFCNTSTPAPVTTHLPAALVTFHSDSAGAGKGFRIIYTILDGCGSVLTSARGDISPPMSSDGKYEDEQDCEWRIQLPLGDRIKIVFETFDLEDMEVCDDFVEVRDGPSPSSPLVGRWCGTSLPPAYVSSSNTLTIVFHSDMVIGGAGFKIHYKTMCGGEFTSSSGEIRSPNYPQPYTAERECLFIISTPPSTVIQLEFQDFEIERLGSDPDCEFDYVEIRDGDSMNSTLIGKYCGSEIPPTAISSFNYLYVIFNSDVSYQYRGFLANYSTIDMSCGGIMKQSTGMFSAPQNEDGYLPNSECKWLISAQPGWVIQLAWLAFHLEFSRDCRMDAVEVYENNTETGKGTLLDRYCGLRLPPTTTSTTNLMTVRFHADDSVHREGFTAHYVMVDKRRVCGGTVRSIVGSIETPGYPEDYSDNKECIWIIHVPQGQQIKLTFATFDVEGVSANCPYDHVTIRNGLLETSPLVGRYCGARPPPDVMSLTNGLWIHFSSDRSATAKGFRATWDATATGCGGTLTSLSGTITSPNYPQPYARYAECYFKISVSQGSQIRLSIVDLDLEVHSRCRLDYIELYDGLTDQAQLLGRYCSASHPPSLKSSKNHMFLKFHSDISYSGRGFHLKYNTDCNNTLRSHYGVLESPNYPNKYLSGLNCMWVLQAPKGNKLNISFVNLDLEDSARPFALPSDKRAGDCKYDYLEVSEGTKDEPPSKTLGRFCGSEIPSAISSQLDHVYIHFVTDQLIEKRGFHLEWVVSGCGGVYRDKPVGSFTSPNYPHGYSSGVECEWQIIAPWDASIEITINDMQLEDLGTCNYDYLAIWSGEDGTGHPLLQVCHSQKEPLTVTTSGNHAFIKFETDHSLNSKGFSASWRFVESKCGGKFTSPYGVIHSHNYPKNYENHDDCEWLIQVPVNHLINLTFTDFDVEASFDNTTTDYVMVFDGNSTSAPVILSHSGRDLPSPPYLVSSSNTLLIRHKADGSITAKGFRAQYHIACGARISARGTGVFALGDVMSASSPWAPQESSNCTWYIIAEDPADKITLTFTFLDTSPNTENDDSSCSYNYVSVHDGDTNNGTILSRVCGTKLPPPVRSSGGALTVEAVSLSTGRNHIGRFSALYTTYSTECGGELLSEQGAIASPNYPDGYPTNADCVWELKASAGNKVTLSFLTFELEQMDNCDGDYVEVRTGSANGSLHGVFCGSQLPSNITAANVLWVRFRTDGLGTAKGFMAEYSLVHGNDLTGDSGQIASPLYPHNYVQSGDYKWTISVASNKVVRITFTNFYTDRYGDDPSDCSATVEIFDGIQTDEDSGAPSLLKACGPAIPLPVTSTNNIVTIVFINLAYVHGSYFLLNWQALPRESTLVTANTTTVEDSLGCGQMIQLSPTMKNSSATITTPGYPKDYKPDLECTWIISTDPGFHLELKFTALDLEQFDFCDADYITVYTESTTDLTGWSPLSSHICFPNTTSQNFVAGQRMKVYFESDSSEEKTGFSAKVTAACGGLLMEPTGKLDTTVLQANTSTGKVTCDWEFKVRSGRTIQFTFEQFDLPKLGHDSCTNNYIMFRNGGHKDSPPLGSGKYCGNVIPQVLESTSNRVVVSYYAMASAPGIVLVYKELDFMCRHDIMLGSQRSVGISTPNYPQTPTAHITCTWTITAPPGESIQLDFTNRFDIKFSHGCSVEYVEVRDGSSELSPLIGRYCLTTPPPKVTQNNRLFIKYFTDTETPNNGFTANVSIATCGGTYFDQSKITLTSPKYPGKYSPDMDCLWRIVGANVDYQLRFNVTELSLGYEERCDNATDYLEFISVDPITKNMSDSLPRTRLCGQVKSETNGSSLVPPSSFNEMYIRFHSGSRDTPEHRAKRFSITVNVQRLRCNQEITAPSGVITSPGYPSPVPRRNYFYCTWLITVPEGRRVSFKMLDFDLEPSKELSWSEYKLSFYSNNNYMVSAAPSTPMIGKTIDSYSNKMRIHYYEEAISGAHRGFKAEFSSEKPSACGGQLEGNGTVGFSAVGQNLTSYWCEWLRTQDPLANNQTTFTLTINGTLNNRTGAVCNMYASSEDSIIVTSGKMVTAGKILGQICENTQAPVVIRSPFHQMSITARKRAGFPRSGRVYNTSIADFSISFKTDPCGGYVSGPKATITSPFYPAQYPENFDCAWLVNFQEDSKIHVKFEGMDLDADCSDEFVRLYNGDTALQPHLSAPLCGNNVLPPLISQGNTIFIEFHSGRRKGSHSGFKITLTQDESGCGGVLHSTEGMLESPNYNKPHTDYPNNTECEWTVALPSGFHASLSFLDRFSLETSDGCTNDFIQIFDWRNGKWQQIGKNLCGRVTPADIKTTSNQFRVLFRTDSAITSDGFQLSWKNLCGGVIDVTDNGVIISPNYPKPYFGNLNCVYTLLAPNKTIYGKFDDFQVEESVSGDGGRCRFDNVTLSSYSTASSYLNFLMIRYRLRSANPKQQILCGTQLPEPIYSYSKLELVFSTDAFLHLKGFMFSYSVANCGSNITAPMIISNPNNTYMRNCTWFITAPPDKIVVFKVQKVGSYYGTCTMSGLRLYDGHNVTNSSSLIDSVCSVMQSKRTRYLSSSNLMAVQYYSESYIPLTFQAAFGFTYGPKHKCGGVIYTADVRLPYILTAPDVNHDDKYEALLFCDWTVLAPESHQIRVRFDKLDIQNCTTDKKTCSCDVLEIRDGDSESHSLVGRFCGSTLYPDIVSSTGSLMLHFSSDGDTELSGFQLTISTFMSPCGLALRNVTRELQVLESPGYPSLTAEMSQLCLWHLVVPPSLRGRGSGMMSVRFIDFDLSSSCSHNFVELSEKFSASSNVVNGRYSATDSKISGPTKLCHNRTSEFTFGSKTVQIYYVAANARGHRGFRLEYKMRDCSGNYTTSFGRIVGNQIYQNYDDRTCFILIKVPQANATISLYFNAFFCTVGSSTSHTGKMIVYDGSSEQAQEIGTFCGPRRPNPIFSSGPSLYITFQTVIHLGKFDITYTSTDQGRGCGGTLSDLTGSFSSPLYPSPHKQVSACRWDITIPRGNKILFDFLYFDIGHANTCNTNYIQFFDVDEVNGAETLHSKYCGQLKPAAIQMNGDTARVRYVTTEENNGSGWFLRWSSRHHTDGLPYLSLPST